MGCLVALFGFIAVYYGIAGLPMMYDKGVGYFIYALFLETVVCALFVVFLRKYNSTERKEERHAKKQKAQEILEDCRKRTTIVSTRIIGIGPKKHKNKLGKALFRGAIWGFFGGGAGATLGAATAMNKNLENERNTRVFLVKYLDGHSEEKEAIIGTSQYREYMKYLDQEE